MSDSGYRNINGLLEEISNLNSKISGLEGEIKVLKESHLAEIFQITNKIEHDQYNSEKIKQLSNTIFETIGQPILILDREQRIKAANNFVLKSFNKTFEEIKGRFCYELFHDNNSNRPPVNCPCLKVLKTSRFHSEEMEVEIMGGTYLVSCTPVFDNLGEIDSIIHVATDISEKKLAEKANRNNKVRVEALLNAIPDLMFRISNKGILLDYKADPKDLYFYSENIIGSQLFDLLPSALKTPFNTIIQKTLNTCQVQTFEYQLDIPNIGMRDYEARMVKSGEDEVIAIVRDITEDKINRKALQESEANMIAAQKVARLGSWEINPFTGIGTWSAEMYDLLDFDPLEGTPSLNKYLEAVHPDDQKTILDFQDHVLKTAGKVTFEYRSNPSTRTSKIFLSNIGAECNDKGEIVKLIGTLQDVTTQRQNDERIKKLNRLYAILSEINKTIIRSNSPNELFQKACEIVVNKGNFLMAWIGIIDKEQNKVVLAASSGIIAGFQTMLETPLNIANIKEGSIEKAILSGKKFISNNIAVDSRIKNIRKIASQQGFKSTAVFPLMVFGKIYGTLNLFSDEAGSFDESEINLLDELAADISFAIEVHQREIERKQTEDALAMQHHFFRLLIDSLPDHIYFKDLESRFISINKAHAESFKLTDPLLAVGKTDFDFFSEEHARKAYEDEQNILKTGIPVIDKEEKETWPNGNETWVSSTKLPLYDPDGKLIGTFGLSRDITSRKHIAQELLKAKEKAEESDRLKSAFLANMSHEIRTPMNGILGFADLLKKPDLTGNQQQRYIQVIEQSGRRMLNIINDIVDISKIEAGQMEVHICETHINQLNDHLLSFFEPEARTKNIIISCKNGLDNDKSIIETDKNKLAQVLTNLIKNSLKFTETGEISFGYTLQDNYLEFFVKDTGIGINSELREIIFERFRQGSESPSKEYEGAGLGLSISKAYVEMLEGKIWMESEPEKGTCFYFTVPYKLVKYKEVKEDETDKLSCGQPLTILIADDDITSRFLICEMLKMENIHIISSSNGKEAVENMKLNKKIRLVLIDIKMPVMNGLEAAKQIKKINPNIPVIALTAYAFSGEEKKARASGCDDFITKPIDKQKIFKWIQLVSDKG